MSVVLLPENALRTTAVFAQVHSAIPEARLIRVGGPFNSSTVRASRPIRNSKSIVVLPFLERDALASVYRACDSVTPTFAGRRVRIAHCRSYGLRYAGIASDLPVLREVGGGAAIYCPVDDVRIVEQTYFGSTLKDRHAERMEMIRAPASSTRAKFSWPAYTAKTAQVYRDLM